MVFILGASSLHHAIKTLPKNTRKQIKMRVFTVPGLICNPNTVNKRKPIQLLLNNCFKREGSKNLSAVFSIHPILRYSDFVKIANYIVYGKKKDPGHLGERSQQFLAMESI